MVLHALHLCSGYGGFELALRGIARTVAHVERDAYAAATLVARMEEARLGPRRQGCQQGAAVAPLIPNMRPRWRRPGLVVAELMRRGWRLRLPIVWDKGRTAPESMRYTGRPRWSHEMIYLLTPWERRRRATAPRPKFYPSALTESGSVWHFPARNSYRKLTDGTTPDQHLAPFPDELARRCILPTTLPGDVVFDPFAGTGTVPRVAHQLGRHGIGLELYHGRDEHRHGIDTSPHAGRKLTTEADR